MRAKVVKLYRDKNSKSYRKIGEVIRMSKERFEEINSTSFGIFLECVEEPDDEHDLTAVDAPPADEPPVDAPPAEQKKKTERKTKK